MKKTLFLFSLFFCVNNLIIAQITQIGSPINGSENNIGAGVFSSLNNDGTVLAVGFIRPTATFEEKGMARVFELQNGEWIQKGSDLGNQSPDDRGFHVSLNGDGNILAMSTGSASGGYNSDVIIYEFANNDWQQKGSSIDARDRIAKINDIGDIVIISNPIGEELSIYEFINNDWQIKGNIINSEGVFWGMCVDINNTGNILAVSDFIDGTSEEKLFSNRIYIFENNQWVQIGNIETITNTLASLSINLSNSGEACLISSLRKDSNDDLYLESKIYNYENEIWTQAGNSIITSPTEEFIHIENISEISADGNIVAIGNPVDNGNVMLYKLINNHWTPLGDGIFGNGGEFGRAISFNEDATRLSVGAPLFDEIGFYFGQVTTYEIDYNLFSLKDNLYATDILLHPNPVENLLQITSLSNINKLSIYDITGKLVLEKKGNINQLVISKLAIGLFLVKIETETGTMTKKIIKQ